MASKPFEVPVTGERELAWSKRVVDAAADPEKLLRGIGEDLVESTKQRFPLGVGPDGSKWVGNKPSTIEAMLRSRFTVPGLHNKVQGPVTPGMAKKYAKTYTYQTGSRKGELNKRGRDAVAGKKPLIGESRMLSKTIAYDVNRGASAWELIWGSDRVQAAMMNFGGKKSEFPHLWGDIPARPFVGISTADMAKIEAETEDWLDRLANTPK